MKKGYDLRICTWNVRTLNWEGASIQLADALEKLKADITAIQEMRWTGQGCSKRANCDIYYSCHAERREFGCGFVVSRRLRHHVSNFTPVSERLATIRVKARFFNLSIICAHAPTEEKDDAAKDAFYARLEDTYDRCPNHDVKIILGDFNARLIDFAAARNMVVSSTRFRHLDIHKATWLSPDQKTRNQIDHVVIDGRHASSVMDVRTFRGVNIDSDHYLVAAKIRMRLCRAKNVRPITQRKLDVTRLRSQRTATAYSTHLSELLYQPTPLPVDAGGLWAHISHSMRAAAKTAIGFKRPPTRNQWYDEECRVAAAAKNAAYRRTLQSGATRATCERYREKRKERGGF
ncbi:craniofacial development protein 2-like [Drosophila sulfurigaster albostrigata]|uniref:craniofacial development protein 2-like n=1 Tax=Drosophila sulfurigaster albostrigata TaxID=89887 RepID=UPI002D2196FA|nr:craniofacial development protein 2-like [Drosophila sulfurigaster albostrigata]